MFERYTEQARRTVFVARHEAAIAAARYIEPEHLLLGLMAEGKRVVERFLSHEQMERLRLELEHRAVVPHHPSTDLPFSHTSKRVLAYSAEEAQRLGHNHIGAEHLLLALLRESDSRAAVALAREGLDLSAAREAILRFEPAAHVPHAGRRSSSHWQEGTLITVSTLGFHGHELTITEWLKLSPDGTKLIYETEIRGPLQTTRHAFDFDLPRTNQS